MKKDDYRKSIGKFRRRLNKEAGIRAGTLGLLIGMTGMAAVLLYGRIGLQKLVLLHAGIVAGILFLMSTLFCYIVLFRPRKKDVLKRIDGMGLQERIITMEELKEEDTVIAGRQRQDAKEHLAELTVSSMKMQLYIKPLLGCLMLAVCIGILIILPIPEQQIDEQAEKNALELQLLDELIASLRLIIDSSEVNTANKSELYGIVDALEVSFLPEDTTLTRTAKVATASKRLDMLASSAKSDITLKKQESSEAVREEVKELEREQKLLESTIKEMKDAMGTSINALAQTEGIFWTPVGPSSTNSKEEEPLPPEEEPVISEDLLEALDPLEGGMTSDSEAQQENANTASNSGKETIFDPERGEISYGVVYEEYYQEILKALTEKEISEEMRKIIEDYANSLE